ncbi:MAG TPA: MFS transporter [Gammaproteobacteria bacterium]|nr:MFS transporter [Gammaproteobacteria bacterium]
MAEGKLEEHMPPAAAKVEINVADVIDAGGLNRYRLGVFLLCGLFLIMDGFDVQAMGFVAPALISDWKIANATLGPVFSSGLLGLFLGSMLFGMLGDRIGRRRVLLGATLLYAAFTLWSGLSMSVSELLIVRFVAGLGLGAVLPNATALIGEFSPRRMRVSAMMIVTNGFTVGAMLGGFLAAWLIPLHGWRAVFYVGAAVPLLLLVPMLLWLPESLKFLALRRNDPREIAKWLARVDPRAVPDGDVRFVVPEERAAGVPIAQLFRAGRASATALIWAANFMNVLNAYFISSWLPTVVRDAGHATSTAVLVGTSVQAGGVIGTIAIAGVIGRVGFVPVLTACFAVETVAIALLGQPALPLALLFVVAFLTGWGIFGGQPALNAFSATYYPTDLRSTGLGAALGIGRCAAIVGPLVGAAMMQRQLTSEWLFYGAAVPAVLATVSVMLLAKAGGTVGTRAGAVVQEGAA